MCRYFYHNCKMSPLEKNNLITKATDRGFAFAANVRLFQSLLELLEFNYFLS